MGEGVLQPCRWPFGLSGCKGRWSRAHDARLCAGVLPSSASGDAAGVPGRALSVGM